MLTTVSNQFTNLLLKRNIITNDKKELITYGFELFLSSISSTISILLLSILMKEFWISIIFFLTFIPIRVFSGGYHAKTHRACFIFTHLNFIFILFTTIFTPARFLVISTILLMTAASAYVYTNAPIENRNHPLNTEIRIKNKKYARLLILGLTGIIYTLTLLGIYQRTNFAAALSSFCVAAMMYITKFERN